MSEATFTIRKHSGDVLYTLKKVNNSIADTISLAVEDGLSFEDANLSNYDLDSANLTGANLDNANLKGANLSGANLSNSDFTLANLTGANLDNANLKGSNLTNAVLNLHSKPNAYLEDTALNGRFFELIGRKVLKKGESNWSADIISLHSLFMIEGDTALYVSYSVEEAMGDGLLTLRYSDVFSLLNGETNDVGYYLAEKTKDDKKDAENFVNNQQPLKTFSINEFIIFINETMRNGGEYRGSVVESAVLDLEDDIKQAHGDEAFNLILEIVLDLKDQDKKNTKKQPKKKAKKKTSVVSKEDEELNIQEIESLEDLLSSVDDINIDDINLDDLGDLENEEGLGDINIDEFLND